MSETLRFVVKDGMHSEAQTSYLPYGTRTLRLEVLNRTGRPLKLWLRPESTPQEFPEHLIHGYGDDDPELWVHWGGGEESGATVKMRDFLYKAIPADVPGDGKPHPVYLNLTHPAGEGQPRRVTFRAYTGEKAADEALDSTLKVNLASPTANGVAVQAPVRGVWNEARTQLRFAGEAMPDYGSRWWAPGSYVYRPAGDLPGRLGLDREEGALTLKLDDEPLVEVVDNGWEAGQDTRGLRHVTAELFHFLGERYYVVRLWFLWLDKRIGPMREVPDAERLDVLFDAGTRQVVFLGTDFHYREVWTQLENEAKTPRVTLSLGHRNLDDLVRLLLLSLGLRKFQGNPALEVRERLQRAEGPVVAPMQKGPITGVPLIDLKGFIFPYTIISDDVRKG